jgi:ABC-2 type transport system permease protein
VELTSPLDQPVLRRMLRAYVAAADLGWRIASNWTSPLLFAIYSVLKPISAALILVVMYRAISGRSLPADYLAFLVVGAGFWTFVQDGLSRFVEGISEDRGRYRMLKYVYLATPRFSLYLIGRATGQLATALVSVVIVVAAATPLLGLPITITAINWPLLALAVVAGVVIICALSLAVGMLLLLFRDAYGYGELVSQMLYIVSGAIFPIAVLPFWLQWVAAWSPLTSWLELVRRALLREHAVLTFPDASDLGVLGRLGLTTIAVIALSMLVMRWADRHARSAGLLDRETNY